MFLYLCVRFHMPTTSAFDYLITCLFLLAINIQQELMRYTSTIEKINEIYINKRKINEYYTLTKKKNL